MNQDFAQRRRVALAAAITVILVPAAFLLNRGAADGADQPTGTVVGAVQVAGTTQPTDASLDRSDDAGVTDAMGTTPAGYLDGTVPQRADDPATIAIPRPAQSVPGTATFSRKISNPMSCQVHTRTTIPFNSNVTVTNRDNSRSVQCVASVGGVEPDDDVVLHADAFLRIGDLTDAPLAVELTW